MKKSFLLSTLVLWAFRVCAQFSENFEGVTLTNGTGSLPAGWTQYNLDGLTPHLSLSWMGTNAWVVRDASSIGGTKAATSVSWYSPVGTADDWMVSPPIAVPAASPYLVFRAASPDPTFLDGFQVWVCGFPNPGPNDFMSSPINKVLDVPAATPTFTYYGADLSAWAGQTVHIAWRNNSNDKFILYIDDIQVFSVPNIHDVSVQSVNMDRFVKGNTNVNVNITLQNGFAQPLNSVTVQWSDGTNTYTQQLTGLNIPPAGYYTFNHSTPFNKNVADEFDIVVTASNPNGQPDANPADNSKSAKVSTIVNQVPKVVVIEEGTGTWCGWCPRGFTAMEQLHNAYPNTFAGIAVHNGDPMTVTAYDNALNISGFPGCHVDRHLKDASVTPSLFQQYYADYSTIWPPASLTVTPTLNGNSLSVSVKADFTTTCSDEYRLAVVLTEDGVKGNNTSYNQANYYSGGNTSLPYGNINFQTAPDPVPYTIMWYDHTARALLGGFNGQANSIPPGSFVANSSVTYTFNYTIPAAYNKNKMEAIALLIHTATGRIWNAGKAKLVSSVSTEEAAKPVLTATLFPNPARDVVNLSFTLEQPESVEVNVYDMSGRLLLSKALGTQSGLQQLSLPVDALPEGHYLLAVATPTQSHTQHLTIVR
ncbi:MAG: Omp28-related outer membrane protein [Flavobacteriales bacterium]|nr:Omp28-related outer membrane protein [Flavobacteriales bacterium]